MEQVEQKIKELTAFVERLGGKIERVPLSGLIAFQVSIPKLAIDNKRVEIEYTTEGRLLFITGAVPIFGMYSFVKEESPL